MRQWSISPKETLPVVLANIVWDKNWSGKVVKCLCDNMGVVDPEQWL